jgi:hypothetical protein
LLRSNNGWAALSALWGFIAFAIPQGVALGFRWAAPLALEPEALGSEKIVKKLERARRGLLHLPLLQNGGKHETVGS